MRIIILYIVFLVLVSLILYKKQNKYERYNAPTSEILLSNKIV